MPGKLTVDPIASFPLAPSLRRLPIRRLVSSHLINAFFSFLRPQSLGSQHQAHGHQSHVRHPSTVLAVRLTVPLPSYPIHCSLQLSGSRRPPKRHCTNAPEVAGADKKTNPIPSIPSERPACCTPSPGFSASQPGPKQAHACAVNHLVLQVAACVLCDCCCCHPLVDRGPVACFWSRPSFLLPP
jgi:hypothetical protein